MSYIFVRIILHQSPKSVFFSPSIAAACGSQPPQGASAGPWPSCGAGLKREMSMECGHTRQVEVDYSEFKVELCSAHFRRSSMGVSYLVTCTYFYCIELRHVLSVNSFKEAFLLKSLHCGDTV